MLVSYKCYLSKERSLIHVYDGNCEILRDKDGFQNAMSTICEE